MPTTTDYYELLGVPKGADIKDIKKAYRKLARKFHPDVNPGDMDAERKFKEIGEAYDVLKDPKKKEMYDSYGSAAFDQTGGGAGGYGGGFGGGGGGFRPEDFARYGGQGSDYSDIFGNIFGGGVRSGPMKGQDSQYTMEVEFEDALFGTTTHLSVQREAMCNVCGGSGSRPGSIPQTCPDCKGTGRSKSAMPFFGGAQTCGRCHGSGKTRTDPCINCNGRGNVSKTERLTVKIPAGVDNGSKVRLAGMGGPGTGGGAAGDLFIITNVKPHGFFERRGDNLYCEVPVTITEAALGAKIDVPTKDGMVTMTTPPGTQSGQELRLRGKGVPHLGSAGEGDQYVKLKVVVPVPDSEYAKQLFRDLERAVPQDPRSKVSFRGFRRRG